MVDCLAEGTGLIAVEVAYAKSDEQVLIQFCVASGATVAETVSLSGLLERCPEINQNEFKLGVFGAVCKPDRVVNQGDRIEIYRPLIHDPKDARRQRALKR